MSSQEKDSIKAPSEEPADPTTTDPFPPTFLDEGNILQILMELREEGHATIPPVEDLLNPDIIHTHFRPQSIFFPVQSKGPYVETFYQVVYRDLSKVRQTGTTKGKSNLSADDCKALKFQFQYHYSSS